MGQPDFKLGPLRLWVHRYQFPEATDYWDANWLVVTAEVNVPGQSWVHVNGPFLRTVELLGFCNELETLHHVLEGEANLHPIEPELCISLRGNQLGHISGEIGITPDNMTQEHLFFFEIDQSHLLEAIAGLKAILDRFPVKDADNVGEPS
ncbi:hypothetical protein L1280_002713 [Deinococcus sp. HSC-46F16]|uniref:WapI family immunity protein n=1 Tax=Deinococcus sp. HSC-46F16 TaxID=2910968 RepID=UPI0020A1981B|nr:hypothetical protein [Deinococcus sp. HSC-46F16]MCP2015545.1 hypothetical protein [Deinococcus sp. HSC-46F16]